jgi:hypothetical protein
MKTYTIYLDTKTGRSQAVVEADSVEMTEHAFEFRRGQELVGAFTRTLCFGWVEEMPQQNAWKDEPPEMGVPE